ncbi:MAG: heavy metal transporter [Deltaproteobacteria bacterium CG23_combo_of_CG06-09_8_20_14_all_60_8]|nr:MAG: heavy metal transporter [Desulfobacterales bacterium CG2_30_60_27]PIP44699.1 MAG: heavy metal transporter [Deltaproteobacteria bacterium CG23_combo_of_CG06-09_8_20_14_all_60_8]
MEEKTVHVSAISCGHCTKTIERELRELAGVLAVSADPGTKNVLVQWEFPATLAAIYDLLLDIGYPADK